MTFQLTSTQFFQTLVDGITVGSLYALIALGYTMVYGILKFINFAHSDVFALGVHLSIVIAGVFGIVGALGEPPAWYYGPIVLVLAMLGSGLVGFIIERFAYKPLRGAPRLNVLITAIGVSLLLQNVGQLPGVFGPYPKPTPVLIDRVVLNESRVATGSLNAPATGAALAIDQTVEFKKGRAYRLMFTAPDGAQAVRRVDAQAKTYEAGQPIEIKPALREDLPTGTFYELILSPKVAITLVDVAVVGTAVLLMLALQYLIYSTKLGMAMRAVSFSTRNAGLMGINVNGIISFTFVVGSMLAAAAGFLYALKYEGQAKQTADAMWVMLGLKAFVAAVVGGIGNVRGAVLGGLLIGLIEFFGVAYFGSHYRDAYVFIILILVLLVRPEGVLGKATVEKV